MPSFLRSARHVGTPGERQVDVGPVGLHVRSVGAAAVRLGDRPNDREPEAGATPRPGGVGAREALEQLADSYERLSR